MSISSEARSLPFGVADPQIAYEIALSKDGHTMEMLLRDHGDKIRLLDRPEFTMASIKSNLNPLPILCAIFQYGQGAFDPEPFLSDLKTCACLSALIQYKREQLTTKEAVAYFQLAFDRELKTAMIALLKRPEYKALVNQYTYALTVYAAGDKERIKNISSTVCEEIPDSITKAIEIAQDHYPTHRTQSIKDQFMNHFC